MIKKLLLILLILLLAVALFTACTEKTDAILNELIKEGSAPQPPEPESDPEPEPEAEPESDPEPEAEPIQIRLMYSDEYIASIMGEWPAKNTKIEEFGILEEITFFNVVMGGTNWMMYKFRSQHSIQELRSDYGLTLSDMELPGDFYDGEFAGETYEDGNALNVVLNIVEDPDGNIGYMNIPTGNQIMLVADLHTEYFPKGDIIDQALTNDNLYSQGIRYDPLTGGMMLDCMWLLDKNEPSLILDKYKMQYADQPGFIEGEDEFSFMPYIIFTFKLDGIEEPCNVRAEAIDEAGYFSLSFSSRINY